MVLIKENQKQGRPFYKMFSTKIKISPKNEELLKTLLKDYSPIEIFSLAIRMNMRLYLGKCSVVGCEKEIYFEELWVSKTINGKERYFCVEHAKLGKNNE